MNSSKRRPYTRQASTQLAPETEDQLTQRARRLPLSGPGKVTPIPLSLLPAWLELHGLVPWTAQEIAELRQRGYRKPDGVAIVWRPKVNRSRKPS